MPDRSLAQVAFEAYAESTKWRTFDGRPIPNWGDLPREVQLAWSEAALAVCRGLGPKLDAVHVKTRRALDAAAKIIGPMTETPEVSCFLTLYSSALEDE